MIASDATAHLSAPLPTMRETHRARDTPRPTPLDEDRVAHLGSAVLRGHRLTLDEARELASIDPHGELIYDLFYWANKVRICHVGRRVKFCSIVTGKVGACSEDCHYCSQSKHYKTHVTPAKMRVDEMHAAAAEAAANGASSFGIVNSGRGPSDRELDWMEPFFRDTAAGGAIRPCATLGELKPEQARRLRDMGVERVNHNLETSRRHFSNICSTHTYDDRLNTIRAAKDAGLSICSGGIFGMGETWEDRLDVAFTLRDLGADVVPVNFLNAIDGTPLHGQQAQMAPMEALQVLAVFRMVLPDREIKVAGGREKVLRDLQSWVFFAGASSFLIGNYLTTFGRSPKQDHQMLADLGLGFTTYDEVEHEADPSNAMTHGPGGPEAVENSLMRRTKTAVLALPIVQ